MYVLRHPPELDITICINQRLKSRQTHCLKRSFIGFAVFCRVKFADSSVAILSLYIILYLGYAAETNATSFTERLALWESLDFLRFQECE